MEYYENHMKMFWSYIIERHSIYRRKELQNLDPPWTEDPIVSQFKFTNTFRENDRGTKFVTNYILEHTLLSDENILFNILAYRLFNKIETFMYHGMLDLDSYDRQAFDDKIHILDATETVYTNAFIVSGYSMNELQGMDKIQRLAWIIQWSKDQIENDPTLLPDIMNCTTMEKAFKRVMGITGYGKFLAYQVAVDLSYWSKTSFGEDDFTVMGPGAIRGIDWLFPKEIKEVKGVEADPENGIEGVEAVEGYYPRNKRNYEECCRWLRDRQYVFMKEYGLDCYTVLDDRAIPYITLMSLENSCCEFQKYMKAYYEDGRPRNRYNQKEGSERRTFYREVEEWNTTPYDVFSKSQNTRNFMEIHKDEQPC